MDPGLACRLCTVVAAQTIRTHTIMIKVRRSPAIGSMAAIALGCSLYMGPGLSRHLCTIVTARTISAYATVIKVRRSPAIGSMAAIALG